MYLYFNDDILSDLTTYLHDVFTPVHTDAEGGGADVLPLLVQAHLLLSLAQQNPSLWSGIRRAEILEFISSQSPNLVFSLNRDQSPKGATDRERAGMMSRLWSQ